MSEDNRETAAAMFDRTGQLAGTLAGRLRGNAAVAVQGASAIASTIAVLIRAVGAKDAAVLIADLVERKGSGAITEKQIAEDDASVAEEINKMYQPKEVDTFGTGEVDPDSPLVLPQE